MYGLFYDAVSSSDYTYIEWSYMSRVATTLMMKAVSTSKTSVSFYDTTRRNVLEELD
jgi:hypothetical protein